MRIILFFILSAVFAQDIYVDGNAIYEEDNYAKNINIKNYPPEYY